jgi:DNA recombination protein RmuC
VNPLLYALIGLIAGAGIAALVFALVRRGGNDDSELVKRFELLERAQERGERLIREEMARSREENANAAKTQRGELTTSLESVRGIVDLRLKQLQEDNTGQLERMRATVDEKLQGTLENASANHSNW